MASVILRSHLSLRPLYPLLVLLVGLVSSSAQAEAQIVVPGLESERISEAWVEGDLLLLRTEEGRLYSIPRTAVHIQTFRAADETSSSSAPSLQDIIDLLRAGVSERTIKAYIETNWSSLAGYAITKEALIELKQAGASEDFIQYLIHLGRPGPKTTVIKWRGPAWPPREKEPISETPVKTEPQYQEGIPLYPYVFPGFGGYYPYYYGYPSHPIYPGRPTRPTYPRRPSGNNMNQNLPPGATPGYYWPRGRSLTGRNSRGSRGRPGHGKLRPEPHNSGTDRNNQLWLRWNGPMRGGGSGVASGSYNASPQGTVRSSRSTPNTLVTPSGGGSRLGRTPSMATGSPGRAGGRSISGRTGTRSSSGRSISKKN